ncbi:MAG: mechanosensitive ion channel family protein [Candidatus Omnitrophica bacterium]|nr:mechanosensitive ion channel family protein [Candidatus Omnitrophota bacterium]
MGPAVFLFWLCALWLVKRYFLYRLRRWAVSTKTRWDNIVIGALSFPLDFLILASGLVLLEKILPLSSQADEFTSKLFQGCVLFSAVFFLDRFVKGALDEYTSKPIFSRISHGVAKGVIRGFIIGIGILIFLDLIGISITPILASLGIGSLAVALALQDTLSNFFAGLYVAIDKPIQPGDFIRLENGAEGYVIDVGWRSTKIRTLPNSVVIIPNSKLTGSVLTNYYLPDKELAVLVEVGVDYRSNLDHVEKITCQTAKEVLSKVTGGVRTFDPFVRFHTFAESSINFTVILRAREFVDSFVIKHEFIKALHARFQKEGIVIPFPIRTVEVRRQDEQSIPEPLKTSH